ncbi:biopolymer transporter ExbD [Pseudomonas orientalis]|uniref:biopolymer transporter ExbD n=1 Tax=Pseudomonas orientalis TaxID=76758 RepID=UPI0013D33B86
MKFINRSSRFDTYHIPTISEINVTPFIDVMLVLLVIFMVVAPLSTTNIDVQLPAIERQRQPETVSPLIVTLKNGGDIYIMNDKVASTNEFVAALKKEVEVKKNTPVFLRADKNVSYGDVVFLMEKIQKAGVSNVALVNLEIKNE